MNFGKALEDVKQGKRIARKGWNGKGMFAFMEQGYECNGYETFTGKKANKVNPCFYIKNVDDSLSTWVPSINDCLAEDWEVAEPTKLDGEHKFDGSIDMSGVTSKDEVSEDKNKRVLVTFQVGQVVERVTVVAPKEADFVKYLDDMVYIEGSYACFYKEDGKIIGIKASSIVSVEEL